MKKEKATIALELDLEHAWDVPSAPQSRWISTVAEALTYAAFFSASMIVLAIAGGLAVQVGTGDPYIWRPLVRLGLGGLTGVVAGFTGWRLWKRHGRTFLFGTSVAAVSSLSIVYLLNFLASSVVPSWPAQALHG